MQIRPQTVPRLAAALTLPVLALCGLATTARAQVTSVPLFFSDFYTQTGETTTTLNDANFDARIFTKNPADVTSATLSYSGMGTTTAFPANYSPTADPAVPLEFDINEASDAALAGDVPFGTYTTAYSGAFNGSVSSDYTQNAFSNVPLLTAATYDLLTAPGGVDSTQGLTIAFNSQTTNPAASSDFVFVNIYGPGSTVYSKGFEPATTTSEFVPANTLAPGTNYQVEVIFSDRIPSQDPNSGIDTTLGFDQRTSLNFTTAPAVPEASTTASFGLLLALGLGGLAMSGRRRKAQ